MRNVLWAVIWILFGAGLGVFAAQALGNSILVVEGVPGGMLDHQAMPAAEAARIQGAWDMAGVLDVARFLNRLDLVFIGLISAGGALGALTVAGSGRGALRIAALVCAALWLAFAGFDYAETLAQSQQLNSATPGDGVAPWIKTSKIATYLTGMLSLFGIMFWRARQGA